MKKVWIASILATLMLTVPMTLVVGANEVEDCVECEPVSRVDLLKVKLLMIRLEPIIKVIQSKYSHIPEVEEKCKEALDIIHSKVVLNNSNQMRYIVFGRKER